MTKLRIPLLSFNAVGRLGNVLSFRRSGRDTILERKPEPPDAQSLMQLSWRHMFQKVVALWHALPASEKLQWESDARPHHMTGYAWFVSQALRPNPGIYLPLQGGTMTGELNMGNQVLSSLIDPVAAQEAATKNYHDSTPTPLAVHGHAKHTDRTRTLFLPPSGVKYTGSGTTYYHMPTVYGDANVDAPWAFCSFKVPTDFVSFNSLKAVWVSPAAAGNMYWRLLSYYKAAGELVFQHWDSPVYGVTATLGANLMNVQDAPNPLSLANLAAGDYIGVMFERDGSNVADTINAAVQFHGFLFSYEADQ